ncbi:MAG: hypothetical protein RIQ47_350 [Bacteroidota bacterium]|jgi:hypothetical protein
MSTHELHQLIHQQGIFQFFDGRQEEGMIISRYNIRQGRVEYYFIPNSKLEDYMKANANHTSDAHLRFGNEVDVANIAKFRRLVA